MKRLNLKALFVGDKAENGEFYKDQLTRLTEEHMGWRENYIPSDMLAITEEDKEDVNFVATQNHILHVLDDLSQRMRSGSIPWQSAGRYWGQMNSETLMPAILAYNFAILWNPNNVALESSMATSQMEAEVGEDFAKLFNFKDGWGHIVADGSLANLEGLWYARCFKSIPLAIKEVYPDKVSGMTDWQLLNMSVEEVLDAVSKLSPDEINAVKAASSRSGKFISRLGKWIVPQTKHYSWEKALDISGVGLDQMISIPVSSNYRMDVVKLEEAIRDLADKRIPILGVVAVVGTTEEGAVDEVDKIIALRETLKKEGIYFYLHVDAAYGGYARSLFLNKDNEFVEYNDLAAMHKEYGIFHYPVKISEDVYRGFKAIQDAESVTVDPHKMGYVPYAAGGIAIKHKDMRNIISYFASYVFEESTVSAPDLLGAYILEGSKAGATAAAVWTAHQILPLNVEGYGQLVASTVEVAQRFRDYLGGLTFVINGKTIEVYPLNKPDFNMVDWVFKEKGCTDLREINTLNEKMYDYSSYLEGSIYNNRFISSHTTFNQSDYGDSPLRFVEKMGLPESEWQKEKQVTLMRAAIMTPYLNDDKLFDFYANAVKQAMQKKLSEVLSD